MIEAKDLTLKVEKQVPGELVTNALKIKAFVEEFKKVIKDTTSLIDEASRKIDAIVKAAEEEERRRKMAEIERDLISERIKNSLRAKRAQGVKLGRPEGKGRKVEEAAAKKKVVPEALIESYKNRILTAAAIARLLDLDQRTVRAWLKLKDVKRG